ncbi:MAG TPA: flagellar basal body-associated FliL family protein [Xanthomonadaceae bacterium]|nr:flagellar basal body-associated FliL family protein [Xanthomonadaceae bacterium]
MPAPAAPDAAPTPAVRKKPAPRRSRKAAWLLVAIVLLGGGAGGGWWMWHARAEAAAAKKKPAAPVKAQAQYYALEPAFVVNLADADAVRYLQVDVQLMTRDAATLAAMEQHAPALRNRLLLLFGQQTSQSLAERRGKERLQQQALAEVRAVLKGEAAADRVEAVYFTSLVTQ